MTFYTAFCTVLSLAPATAEAAQLIHLTTSETSQSINANIDMLEDSSSQLSFEEVISSPLINQFAPQDRDNLRFGFSTSTYWLRFSILNHLADDQTLWLEIQPPNLEEIQFYSLERGAHPFKIIRKTDSLPPHSVRQYPQLITLTAKTGTVSTYYLRIKSDTPLNLDLFIHSPKAFTDYALEQTLFSSTAYGILVTLTLLNVLLGLIFREELHLIYGMYLSVLTCFLATADGQLSTIMPISSHWHMQLLYAQVCLADSVAVIFAYYLLSQNELADRWRKTIICSLVLNALAYIAVLILPSMPAYSMIFVSEIVTAVILMLAPLHCYLANNNPFTLLIMLARVWLILAIITALFAVQGVVSEFNLARLWLTYAFNVEALLILLALIGLSYRKQQQRMLADRTHAIADAESRAQADIFSRISHDIRTPISGVLGMTELLMDTSLTPKQKDHVQTIQSSGKALLSLVSEIHDRSKIDAGLMEIEQMPFDLAMLINDCIDTFRSEAEEKSIELISHIHADVPLLVTGDALRLRQILQHMLGNAFKYTEKGEIVLTTATQHDQNAQSSTAEYVLFVVSDTGRGISKDDQQHLFTPVTREDNQQLQYGLGLSTARQLIEKMEGEMGVESELGKGSKFWFSIPLPAQHISKEMAYDIETGLRNKRMLVVDDNQTCRKVIQQQASAWGMKVSTAHSGNEALAITRAKNNLNEPFDIIIVDFDMPNMTGLQLAGKIQDEMPGNRCPLLIMLTGLSNAPTQKKAREAGIRRVLTKPVTGNALKITLAEELHFIESYQGGSEHMDPEGESLSVNGRPLQVLLAEDNPVSEKVMQSLLRKLGTHCTTVHNGAQALESAKSDHFDLLLMDCEMPVMDGYEATRKIRQWEKSRQRAAIPIIALTAHIADEHIKHSQSVGMNDYLTKPVELKKLFSCLKKWSIGKQQQ